MKYRTIRLLHVSPAVKVCCFLVRETKRGRATEDRYIATETRGGFGRKFSVAKLGEGAVVVETYHVGLGEGDGHTDVCSCPGNRGWGRCRHCDGIKALLGAGKLWK